MKVLFIVDNLGAGGAERSLQEMLGPLGAGGVDPLVACFEHRSEGVEHLVSRSRIRVLPGTSAAAQMSALRHLARHERVDLAHTTLFKADVCGRPALLGLGIPIVTSLVNMPYEPARLLHDRRVNAAKLGLARSLEILTGFACADHFHAISHAVKDAATKHLWIDPHKISVILRGRDPARLGRRSVERRRNVRHTLDLPDDTPVILSAGRQEFQKGQLFLLGALARVLAAYPRTTVLIAGRAGNASSALAQAAAPFGNRVRFLGHREDLPDLMAAADVFALPSLWEGLGCVIIEAMALELPIVASDLAPVREAVDVDARFVTPASPSALAEALMEVLASPDVARARTVSARRRFEETLTIEKSSQQMLRLFQRVVGATRKDGAL